MKKGFPKIATAYKVYISDIVNGEIISTDFGKFLKTTQGIEAIRARLFGIVVNKFESETGDYVSLTIDDGTETIRVKTWKKAIKLVEDVKTGDFADIVGRIREYEEEIYIVPEIVIKGRDSNWWLLRELELLKMRTLETNSANYTVEKEEDISEAKNIVLHLIRELDEGSGTHFSEIIKKAKNLKEEEVFSAVIELLHEGNIYEPKSGFYSLTNNSDGE